MKLRLAFLFVVLTVFQADSQGLLDGFFKGKGNTTVALGLSFETSSKYWAGPDQIDFGRNMASVGVFATHGIVDGLDVVVSLPFVNFQPQDASIFLKGRVLNSTIGNGQLTFAIAGGFSNPISSYNTESSNAIGQRATIFEPRGIIQYQLNSGLFIQGQVGYTYALDPVPSGIPASVKLGYAKSEWYADIWFDYRETDGKDYRGVGELAPESFRELGVDYQRIGATFYKPFSNKFGVSLGAAYTLQGRNTFQSTIFSAAAVWNPSLSKK